MDTNFEKVVALNASMGRQRTNKKQFETDYGMADSQIISQFKIVCEEFEELKHAVETGDWEEIKDGIADVLVTTYGLGYVIDIDCDALMDNVSDSNFSKFCAGDDITTTVSWYNGLGVQTSIANTGLKDSNGQDLFAIKSACDQSFTTPSGETKQLPKGKLLKNTKWFEPDLDVENEIR